MRIRILSNKNGIIPTFFAFTLIFLLSLSQTGFSQNNLEVRYMEADSEVGHIEYYNILLRLALEKTVDSHGEFTMVPSERPLPQLEALHAVRTGDGLDVFQTMTDSNRERIFIPVRVPLVQGLIGARLLMINEQDQNRLSGFNSIEQIKDITLGQGADWPDTRVLQRADLNVETTDSHSGLFELLKNRSIDAFPRAVFEIWDEIEAREEENFTVANGYYIYYPTAVYFFTQRSEAGRELANRLEIGLNRAIDDGSFQEVFMDNMGMHLERANLSNRNIIRLDNPFLPASTPLDESKYWYISQ